MTSAGFYPRLEACTVVAANSENRLYLKCPKRALTSRLPVMFFITDALGMSYSGVRRHMIKASEEKRKVQGSAKQVCTYYKLIDEYS